MRSRCPTPARIKVVVARVTQLAQGDPRLVRFCVDSPQLLRDQARAGDLLPLTRGAGRRVLMAFAGARGRVCDQVRRDGFLLIKGDRVPGLVRISAPVWNAAGERVGALTLTVPEQRLQRSFVGCLGTASAKLTTLLGGVAPGAPG